MAHGNPEDKGDVVHVFLSGQHRSYRWDRVGDFGGRLRLIQSACMKGHDPYAYLKDVLTRLPTQQASEINQLMPQ